MAIVFDEIEATVLPGPTPSPAGGDTRSADGGAQPEDAHALQRTLVRMLERAERLRAD